METLSALPLFAQIFSVGSFAFASGLLMTRFPLLPALTLSFFYMYGIFKSGGAIPSFAVVHPWIVTILHGVVILPLIGVWLLFLYAQASSHGPDSMGLGFAGIYLIIGTCSLVVLLVLASAFPALFKFGKLLAALHSGAWINVLYVLLFAIGIAIGVFSLSITGDLFDNSSILFRQFILIGLIAEVICLLSLAGIASGNIVVCSVSAFIVLILFGGFSQKIWFKTHYLYLHSPKQQELIGAAENGNTEEIKLLLDKGSKVDARDNYENTALIKAAEAGNLEAMRLLLEAGADINACNSRGDSALYVSVEQNKELLVRELIKAGAKINTLCSNDPLLKAVREDYLDIALLLIQSGADVNIEYAYPYRSVLIEAAINGNAELVDALLKAGADVNKRDFDGKTALQFALGWEKREACAKLIYEAGGRLGKISDDDQLEPKMDYACSLGLTEAVAQLLEAGVKPNAHFAIMAAQEGRSEVLKLFIDAGLDINQKDEKGNYILLSAVGSGDIETVKLLVENGADITLEKNDGNRTYGPALILAALEGRLPVVEYLAGRGADLDIQNSYGETALILAVARDDNAVVEFLIKAGANVNSKNKDGKTALAFAREKGYKEIESLLKSFGAK